MIEEEGSNYGTDSVPTGADALKVTDLSITPQVSDVVSRSQLDPSFLWGFSTTFGKQKGGVQLHC